MALGGVMLIVDRKLLFHSHVIHHKVAHHAYAQYKSTLVQVEIRGVVRRSFGRVSSFFHAAQPDK